ncbi:transcription repressor OFP5 [Manihot esculenta]|uniref:Uncharacterized protein n=2 Tax=Manihot esculenta TaxID=3983 RepID=A0ACB7G5H0_MANES|nr:transcription repressor OFP5 [Manihot esculenta]KAG8635517.1 hypothetical protein MANES_16G038730v8 [Manihot esculenta]
MKWGKKKPSSSSASSRPFLISQVLPTSWLTKFKQTSISSRQKHAKVKQKEKWNSVSTDSSACANSGGKIYGGDGDAFWRLSFGEDSLEGMNYINVSRSVQYNSDDDLEFLASSHHSCKSKASRVNGSGQTQKFSNMVSPVKKMKELLEEEEILPERTSTREKEAEIRTPRLKVRRDEKLRKGKQRDFEGKQLELDGIQHEAERIPRNAAMKNVFETEPQRTGGMVEREDCKLAAFDSRKDCYFSSMNSRDSHGRKIEVGCDFPAEKEHDGFSTEKFSFERQRLKEKKIEELKSRSEEQRKSLCISRELQRKRPKQNSKLKVYSPRTASKVEICKIKALEDMKKAKLKMKKKAKDKEMEEFKDLESFAMVKFSYDPQKDFRDSMTEMIREQRISQLEELEELLACYLTLNSDEFHGLIIRAFQQVWFNLNQACFTEFDNEECH